MPLKKEKPSTMTLKERKFYFWLGGGDMVAGPVLGKEKGYLGKGQRRAEVQEGCVRERT